MLPIFMAGKHTIKVNGVLTTNNYQNDQKLDPRAPAQTFYKDKDGNIVQHGKEPEPKPDDSVEGNGGQDSIEGNGGQDAVARGRK